MSLVSLYTISLGDPSQAITRQSHKAMGVTYAQVAAIFVS